MTRRKEIRSRREQNKRFRARKKLLINTFVIVGATINFAEIDFIYTSEDDDFYSEINERSLCFIYVYLIFTSSDNLENNTMNDQLCLICLYA